MRILIFASVLLFVAIIQAADVEVKEENPSEEEQLGKLGAPKPPATHPTRPTVTHPTRPTRPPHPSKPPQQSRPTRHTRRPLTTTTKKCPEPPCLPPPCAPPPPCPAGFVMQFDPCNCTCPKCVCARTCHRDLQKTCPKIVCKGVLEHDPCGCKCPVCRT